MDQFRTAVEIPKYDTKISYRSKILMLGSCFVENIGKLLLQKKFNTLINPFGVVYNPVSIASSLQMLIDGEKITKNELNFKNGLYFSYQHHSSFSNKSEEKCLQSINTQIQTASLELASADILFLTFGTSWVYELIDSGKIVSNCHKQPASCFNRYRLEIDEIVHLYKNLILSLSLFNPQLKIILTISPIRHWKDGAHENQLSKSTLLLATNQLVQLFNHVSYFPSYEIVMDELRDYRFYHEDMLRLSPSAIHYIWSQFTNAFMEKETHNNMKKISKITAATKHRPFNPHSESHQQFIRNSICEIEKLEKLLPELSFEKERALLATFQN